MQEYPDSLLILQLCSCYCKQKNFALPINQVVLDRFFLPKISTKKSCKFLASVTRTICLEHLIIMDFIMLISVEIKKGATE
jgi:hypothetical protein